MHGLMSYRRFGRARSLRIDARSLRSDRAEWTIGRYVATELGCYVAMGTEICTVDLRLN
ncbi:hypothetical protein F2Q69_00009655 [Brassica cretica]|uniref:Uncharacterized protein n=1 Tax=Brassica cretica TaxID=69181 RepID=A0A8S9P3E2_BRACR|nr:hypothetical protein F2Q69_00009655 [Brassica cretica]